MIVAATPETWGVAMLQPLLSVYWLVVPALAEVTTVPVATTLGFIRPSPAGPRLLELLMSPMVPSPLSSTLPTASAFLATPGDQMVPPPGPLLPPQTIQVWRVSQTIWSRPRERASVPTWFVPLAPPLSLTSIGRSVPQSGPCFM